MLIHSINWLIDCKKRPSPAGNHKAAHGGHLDQELVQMYLSVGALAVAIRGGGGGGRGGRADSSWSAQPGFHV